MNRQYKVIDLFAGAGGLSYGFEQAGLVVDLAIEKDAWAVETYKLNHRNKNVIEADITTLSDDFFERYKGKIDVVMGGPPCQGFSIAASNRRRENDSRNTLYQQFLRVVNIVEPKIVLIENVKEIVNYQLQDGRKIVDDIAIFLKERDYTFDYKILNCRNYGIPQDRKRFFFLAIKKELVSSNVDLEKIMSIYTQSEICFDDAVNDLPVVKAREFAEDAVMEYTDKPHNSFQKAMRGNSILLHNHIPMRHTEKTVKKFEFLLNGSGDGLPEDLLPRVRGNIDEISYSQYSQNHRIINGKNVSPTITASFYSSFIHPHQPRNLTVREAARIQTFPDTFIFKGKKTTLSKKLLAKKGIVEELHLDQFNQVGNAVPPMMAKYLASICKSYLEREKK